MMRCRIYKWWLASAVDNGTEPGARSAQHMESCVSCRSYYQGQLKVMQRLVEDTPVSPCIHRLPTRFDRIALGTQTHSNPLFKQLILAAASILLVMAVGLPTLQVIQKRRVRIREHTDLLASAATLSTQVNPERLLTTYRPVMKSPLETEVENLSLDARNAAQFLVKCSPFWASNQTP